MARRSNKKGGLLARLYYIRKKLFSSIIFAPFLIKNIKKKKILNKKLK